MNRSNKVEMAHGQSDRLPIIVGFPKASLLDGLLNQIWNGMNVLSNVYTRWVKGDRPFKPSNRNK